MIAPGPPSELKVSRVRGHFIELMWKEPEEPNGDIQSYMVYIWKSANRTFVVQNTTGPETELIIQNLTAGRHMFNMK